MRQREQFIRLRPSQRERLIADHMFPREQGRARPRIVEKMRCRDAHEIDLRAREQRIHLPDIVHPEAPRHGLRRLAVRAGDPHEPHARRLEELLQR